MGLTQPDRYGAALVTAALAVVLCAAARRWPGRWTVLASRLMAVGLVVNLVIWQVVIVRGGTWNASADLMVDLCPVANVVTAVALWTRRPLLVDLAYFWACAGCIQGILQPDQRWTFPGYFYFQFYVDHAGVLVAALFLVVGLGCRPRAGAVPKVFGL